MSRPVEPPIGWRVCIQPVNTWPFDNVIRPKPQCTQIFSTKEAAEAENGRQGAWFGEVAIIHIEPAYIRKTKRELKLKSSQQSLTAAGWPVQMRPPRPGVLSKSWGRPSEESGAMSDAKVIRRSA